MTEQEARAECARLAADHPGRAEFIWFARETAPGEWSVVRVRGGGLRVDRERMVEGREPSVSPDPALDRPVEPKPWSGF